LLATLKCPLIRAPRRDAQHCGHHQQALKCLPKLICRYAASSSELSLRGII
jgi:hypothetical protein